MEAVITLKNNNKIYCENRVFRQQTQSAGDFSIRFALSGNEVYHVNRRELSVYPDSFLILNKGTQYTSKIDSNIPVNSFSISFDQHFINDFDQCWKLNDKVLLDGTANDPTFGFNINETIYPFKGDLKFNIHHLKRELEQGAKDEMLINEYLHHCLINYYGIYQNEIFKKAEKLNFQNRNTKLEILKRLNVAKDFIYSNYNKNITLEELAGQACLSVNHLLRTFKQAFNVSPHQFLMELRLQRAKLLLKSSAHSINEIVNIVGFECPSSFIRLFKNRYNTTPLKFKKAA